MAQHPKEATRERFLTEARAAFDAHGFDGTSMRQVAAAAGRSLGNLRNYYPTKDDLFAAACAPTVDDVRSAIEGLDVGHVPQKLEDLSRVDTAYVYMVAGYIERHREPLARLVSKSAGSRHARWSDDLFDAYVDLELRRLDAVIAAAPDWLARPPSEHMIRALCRMYFELARDFVLGHVDAPTFWATLREYDAFRHRGMRVYTEKDAP